MRGTRWLIGPGKKSPLIQISGRERGDGCAPPSQWTLPSVPIPGREHRQASPGTLPWPDLWRLFGDVGTAFNASSFAEAGLRTAAYSLRPALPDLGPCQDLKPHTFNAYEKRICGWRQDLASQGCCPLQSLPWAGDAAVRCKAAKERPKPRLAGSPEGRPASRHSAS